ncbi:MAG: transposase, partial [Sedimentisphaerales bacterium]
MTSKERFKLTCEFGKPERLPVDYLAHPVTDKKLRAYLGCDNERELLDNAQAVTTEEQIIVAEDVTQQENDKQQLHPMLEQTESNRKTVGIKEKTGVALADAGYCSEDNFSKSPAGDVELLVAVQKDYKQRKAIEAQPP